MNHGDRDQWSRHYEAMKRWKKRALAASYETGMRESDGWLVDSTSADDFGRAYFVWAHSLRDWLIVSRAVERKKLDSILEQQDAWRNARDFANKTKHSDLTRNPKDPNWVSGMKLDANALLRGEHGIEPYVYIAGRSIRMGDAILEVDEMWDRVLVELNLKGDAT